MIRPYQLHQAIKEQSFVPQALIAEEIFQLADRLKLKVEKGADDFDYFVGAAALLDNLPFALMQYRGHPQGTSTIYLPFEIQDIAEIAKVVSQITSELKLSEKAILWQRNDDFKEKPLGG